jgi:hypothetical protein
MALIRDGVMTSEAARTESAAAAKLVEARNDRRLNGIK